MKITPHVGVGEIDSFGEVNAAVRHYPPRLRGAPVGPVPPVRSITAYDFPAQLIGVSSGAGATRYSTRSFCAARTSRGTRSTGVTDTTASASGNIPRGPSTNSLSKRFTGGRSYGAGSAGTRIV